MDRNKGSCVK
ncbi:unnamed protein product, partial [Rotaria magnacalcarata]